MNQMKERMIAFLAGNKYCVISTVDPSARPESAYVAFSNKGLDIFIGTSAQSRKFMNLTLNPLVAVVVADETAEIQYEGEAVVVGSDNHAETENQHVSQIPGSDKYREDPNQRYIHIRPTWIRYIEHGDPDVKEEFTEFSE